MPKVKSTIEIFFRVFGGLGLGRLYLVLLPYLFRTFLLLSSAKKNKKI